jgi:hypothetical protein
MDRNPIFHDYAHHALLASIGPTLALPLMVSQVRPVDEYIRPDGGVRQMRPVYFVSTPTKSSGPFVSTPSGSASKPETFQKAICSIQVSTAEWRSAERYSS